MSAPLRDIRWQCGLQPVPRPETGKPRPFSGFAGPNATVLPPASSEGVRPTDLQNRADRSVQARQLAAVPMKAQQSTRPPFPEEEPHPTVPEGRLTIAHRFNGGTGGGPIILPSPGGTTEILSEKVFQPSLRDWRGEPGAFSQHSSAGLLSDVPPGQERRRSPANRWVAPVVGDRRFQIAARVPRDQRQSDFSGWISRFAAPGVPGRDVPSAAFSGGAPGSFAAGRICRVAR